MAGKIGYKKLLVEARNLQRQAGTNAHRRAVLLTKVFSDREFRSDIGATDDRAVAQILDKEVEDLCLSFVEIKTMLSEFPDECDWRDGKLATLYAKTVERIEAREQTEKEPAAPRTSHRISRQEFVAVDDARKDAEAKADYLSGRVETMDAELKRLRVENAELQFANAELSGRLIELERLLDRDRVASDA